MRQDKERSIREQADLWKGYWCILACILLVGRVSYLTFFQNHIVSVYAAAQTEQKEDSSVQILQENLMEEIQIDDVQKMLDEIMDDHVFSVRKALPVFLLICHQDNLYLSHPFRIFKKCFKFLFQNIFLHIFTLLSCRIFLLLLTGYRHRRYCQKYSDEQQDSPFCRIHFGQSGYKFCFL